MICLDMCELRTGPGRPVFYSPKVYSHPYGEPGFSRKAEKEGAHLVNERPLER